MSTDPKFVTIDYFIKQMLGYKSRISYYNHRNDAGFPQRVYPFGGPGSKPMLVYAECAAYLQLVIDKRDGVTKKPGRKRHPGRPAKQIAVG